MSRSDAKKTITTAVLTAAVASACERAPPASEELAKEAERARAALVASAAAAVSGAAPLGAPVVPLEEAFRAQKPTALSSPKPLTPCSLDQVDGAPAGPITTVDRKTRSLLIGWAADGTTGTVPPVVVIELSGKQSYYLKAVRLTKRPDVVRVHKVLAYMNSGYDALALFRAVEPGEYAVHVLQVTTGGDAFTCDTGKKLQVE